MKIWSLLVALFSHGPQIMNNLKEEILVYMGVCLLKHEIGVSSFKNASSFQYTPEKLIFRKLVKN